MDILLNWIWQGAIVAIVAAAALGWLAQAPARIRFGVASAALAAVVALPIVPILRAAAAARVAPAFAAAPPPVAVALPAEWWTSDAIAIALGGAWLAIAAARLLIAAFALVRAGAAARPFPAGLEARLPAWRRVRASGRPARLVLSPRVATAAVVGVRAPVIAVAPALAAALDAAALDRVVIHEWAHVQRRDDRTNLLLAIAGTVAGWHPAAWWLQRRIRLEREIACDELAVSITGSPRAYASSLAAVADHALARRAWEGTLGVGASSGLRCRIERLLAGTSTHVSGSWTHVAFGTGAVPALVALVVGGLPLVATLGPSTPAVDPIAAPLVRLEIAARQAVPRARVLPTGAPWPEAASTPAVRWPAAAELASALPAEPPSSLPAAPVTDAGPRALLAAVRIQPLDTPPIAMADEDAAGAPTPWGAAAGAGVAVGRGSRKAATATAEFFTRVGRSIADSF